MNILYYTKYKRWCHQMCSGLQNILYMEYSTRFSLPESENPVVINRHVFQSSKAFLLPGDMDCEAGVEKAERKKVAAAAWMKWI